ncbi:hypothetical protein EYF80_046962 [Liparis tanakae]|uniref:Uncharacterized protein n=1 Tax=Liparis tanakae TaxID=230148 RepID=A0A4Z2FP00_9TELE|nr:hypothetical protein EYF80_046962 [Liparis tanakae]
MGNRWDGREDQVKGMRLTRWAGSEAVCAADASRTLDLSRGVQTHVSPERRGIHIHEERSPDNMMYYTSLRVTQAE